MESAEPPTVCTKILTYYINNEIKKKEDVIQRGGRKEKEKKNSIAWNQLAASIRELMSSLYPTEALDQESKCLVT